MAETPGTRLKSAREAKRLTIDQVSEVTRIRAQYLLALEAGDWSALPSKVQGRGFLRLYADYLGLDVRELLEEARHAEQPKEPLVEMEKPPQSDTEPEPEPAPEPEPEEIKPVAADEPVPDEDSDEASSADETPAGFKLPFRWPWARQVQTKVEVDIQQDEDTDEDTLDETIREEEILANEPILEQDSTQSHVIFESIGSQLRQRRESLSLTLEEIERHTHVRLRNLKLLEAGDFEQLSSPVQARGMISNYAAFLDLDTDALLLRFADGLQAQRLERNLLSGLTRPRGKRWHLPLWARRVLSIDLFFGLGIAAGLVVFSIWGVNRVLATTASPEQEPTAPSISDVLLATPEENLDAVVLVATPSPLPLTIVPGEDDITSTPEVTEEPVSTAPVQLVLAIFDRAYLRVIADGEVKFDGRVVAGGALTFEANDQIEVVTGNGSAIQVIFNQSNLGLLGAYGEVVTRIYSIQGVLYPTATPPPTETPTPRFSPTPSITPTPIFTPTPTSVPPS